MPKFSVDFVIEPDGREISFEIESETSKAAMVAASERLNMEPGDLLHTIHVHIGCPHS